MGRMVQILADEKIALPASSTDDFRGITRSSEDADVGQTVYPIAFEIEIADKGGIFVDADGPIKSGDPVYVRFRIDKHIVQIQFDVDFVALNQIEGGIGQEQITPIVYQGVQLDTIRELANALSNLTGVTETVIVDDKTIVIAGEDGKQLLATVFVFNGVTQPTVDVTTVSGPSTGNKLGGFRADDDDTGTGPAAVLETRVKIVKGGDVQTPAIMVLNLP